MEVAVVNTSDNPATPGFDTVTGSAGTDRLIVTFTVDGGVDLLNLLGGFATGYSGFFDGPGASNVAFAGFEHFTFMDMGNGVDRIQTGDGDDSLSGGLGNDTLLSGRGIDWISGGDGIDLWGADKSFATEAIVINLINASSTYLGTGIVTGIEGLDLITGSGNDRISGSAAPISDHIRTGAGNDTITLQHHPAAADSVDGGAGRDRLVFKVTADGGVDLLTIAGNPSEGYTGVFDAPGQNVSFGGIEHFTFVDSGSGVDRIQTGDGNDSLSGGLGNDTLRSGRGIDSISGGDGVDLWGADKSFATSAIVIDLTKPSSSYLATGHIRGIEGLDLITGSGNDQITGSADPIGDIISTRGGNDTITLWHHGAAADSVDGGSGSDRLVLTVTASGGVDLPTLTGNFSKGYSGVFDAPGQDIRFKGVEHFTFLDRGDGVDRIQTGDGNDSLFGGLGNDILRSGKGMDTVDGGDGIDLWGADKSFATEAIVINLNKVSSTYLGAGKVRGIEGLDLVTGSGNDRITGSSAPIGDTISTRGGNDTISLQHHGAAADSVDGGAGKDRLMLTVTADGGVDLLSMTGSLATGYSGVFDAPGQNVSFSGIEHFTFTDTGSGVDQIHTGDGKDFISTGAGADALAAGGGNDTLAGGASPDRFVFAPGSGKDRVLDFTDAGGPEDDTIDVSAYGLASFAAIGKAASGDSLLLKFGGGDTALLVDYLLDHAISDLQADDFLL